MKVRLITAATIAGALLLSMSGAQAAPPTLDGKKIKVLELTAVGAPQANDADQASLDDVDRTNCVAPRCSRLEFVYKPAKGIVGDLMLTTTWTNPTSDIDLYFGEVLKDGSSVELGHCASAGNPSEKLFVEAKTLKKGKKYVLVADFFRTANETVKSKVEIAVPDSTKTTIPADVDEFTSLNCTL